MRLAGCASCRFGPGSGCTLARRAGACQTPSTQIDGKGIEYVDGLRIETIQIQVR